MEEKQLQNRRDNFAFKLSAAKYHQRKIIEVFRDNKDLIVSGNIDNPKARPFVYHYYFIVYEIYSCFDMTLHFVNKKFAIVFNDEDVKWNNERDKTEFQRTLKTQYPNTYSSILEVVESRWFITLKDTRNYLIHNGIINFHIDYNGNKINVINPIINGKVYHFDLNVWGEEMSKFFNAIYK